MLHAKLGIALPIVVLVSGCVLGGPALPTTPVGGEGTFDARGASMAGLMRVMEQNVSNCERDMARAQTKFAEAMGKMTQKTDAMGKPQPRTSELIAALGKQKVQVTIELASVDMPLPIMKDSFMTEGQKAAAGGQPALQAFAKRAMVVQPLLNPLREQVNVVGGALTSSVLGQQQCRPYADAFAAKFVGIKREGGTVTPEMRALELRLLTASFRGDAMFASSVAVIGTMQAGFAGKNPKAIDTVVDGIAANDPTKLEATDADIDVKTQAVEKYLGPADGPRSGPGANANDKAPLAGPPPKPSAQDCANGGGVVPDIPGVKAMGKVAGALKMACEAVNGLQALKNGDFGGALKSAASIAPPPLGPIFGGVSGMFG